MIPVSVPDLTTASPEEVCGLAERLLLDPRVILKLMQAQSHLPFTLQIISAYRTPEQQEQLWREGRPTADPDKSTHLSCPATGADIRLSVAATRPLKAMFGAEAFRAGLRWGGGSPVDSGGMPTDWNHVDLGPRNG